MQNETQQQRIIRLAQERGDIFPLEDGYQYWRGISANELRIIADELDRLNAEWDKQVREDFGDGE